MQKQGKTALSRDQYKKRVEDNYEKVFSQKENQGKLWIAKGEIFEEILTYVKWNCFKILDEAEQMIDQVKSISIEDFYDREEEGKQDVYFIHLVRHN